MTTGFVMTLANSIIGVGILAMPFCFQKCGILLSIVLLIASDLITRLACHYLLKTSIKVRRRNYEFLASYIFGSSGKLLVELCVIGYLMGTCITYFVVVGDLGPQIISKSLDIKQTESIRTFVMVIVTLFCVIPLGLLKNIESLSFVSISSILFYFCLVIKIIIESEEKIVSGNWYEHIYWWRPSGVTQCLPIFSMALSCQMQIFEIYESLPNQSLEKMNNIVKFGTGMCTFVYILVGSFGYIAFSEQPLSGNILISLSPSFASDIIKLGFVLSVAVSFPLVLFPCRASLYSLLYHRSHSDTAHYIPEHRFKYITLSIVLVALIIGIWIPSIEIVIGLVGSTIGVAICIMFPASCFIKMNKKTSTEKLAAQFLLVFGLLIMILGTYANLGAMDDQQQLNVPIEITVNQNFEQPAKVDKLSSIKKSMESNTFSNSNVDDIQTPLQVKGGKRKIIKSINLQPINKERDSIREINLIDESPIKSLESFSMPKKLDENVKSHDSANQNHIKQSNEFPLPNKFHKSSDSLINKEAIQKEEREIAIEAGEKQQNELAEVKKKLAEVKKEMAKQNQETQKLVLEQIDKISQKVDDMEKKQKNELGHNEVKNSKNEQEHVDPENVIEVKKPDIEHNQHKIISEPPNKQDNLSKLSQASENNRIPSEHKAADKTKETVERNRKIEVNNDEMRKIDGSKENIGRNLLRVEENLLTRI